MQTFPGAQLHLVPVASAAAGRDLMGIHCTAEFVDAAMCSSVESQLHHQGTTRASVAE